MKSNYIFILSCFLFSLLNTHPKNALRKAPVQEMSFQETPIASAYMNGSYELFPDLDKGQSLISSKAKEFSVNYSPPESKKHKICAPSAVVAGIQFHPNIYRGIKQNPYMYGPMYISAAIQDDGTVECRLYVYCLDGVKEVKTRTLICTVCQREHCAWENIHPRTCKTTIQLENVFSWHEAGKALFPCDDPLVKVFVERESRKQLAELYAFINTFPPRALKNLFKGKVHFLEEHRAQEAILTYCDSSQFEKMLYGETFSAYALYKIVRRQIYPLFAAHVAKHGTILQANDSNKLIYFDRKKNIALVIDRESMKIVNAGCHHQEIHYLNAPDPAIIPQELLIDNFIEQKISNVLPTFANADPVNIQNIILDIEKPPVEHSVAENIAVAVVEGVALGASDAIETAIKHPEALLLPLGILQLAEKALQATYQLAKISVIAMQDSQKASQQLKEYVVPLKQIIDNLHNKEACYEALKQAVAFLVNSKVSGKISEGLGAACNKIKSIVLPSKQSVTPEGLVLESKSNQNDLSDRGKKFTPPKYNTAIQTEKSNPKKLDWTPHGDKHVPQPNLSWKEVVEYTQHGKAKYKHGINIENLERTAWEKGTMATNGRTWKAMKFDTVIGAKRGVETSCMRIEKSADTLHGHPITLEEYKGLLKCMK